MQETHTALLDKYPVGQGVIHWKLYKLKLPLQAVQLLVVIEHFVQSFVHALAIPEMFTYPSGTKFKQEEFKAKNIKPLLQTLQVVAEEQSSQFMPKVEQREQIPFAKLL